MQKNFRHCVVWASAHTFAHCSKPLCVLCGLKSTLHNNNQFENTPKPMKNLLKNCSIDFSLCLLVAKHSLKAMLQIALFLFLVATTHAQTPQEARVALLIGNAAYAGEGKLNNPVNDATDIATALQKYGFETTLKTNLDYQAMTTAVADFTAKIKTLKAANKHVTALFYYSGHGVQVNGENYFVPIGAVIGGEADIPFRTYSNTQLLNNLVAAHAQIVMIDACRNNPFTKSWFKDLATIDENEGLSTPNIPKTKTESPFKDLPVGTFISFAAAPNTKASDGKAGDKNSPYVTSFLKMLEIHAQMSIFDLFFEVNTYLPTIANQEGWVSNGQKNARFYFKKPVVLALAETKKQDNISDKNLIEKTNQITMAPKIPNFEGRWIGILKQEPGGLASEYTFSVTLTQDKNAKLSGSSKIEINLEGEYGIISLEGTATPTGINITEKKVVEKKLKANSYWYIKSYNLFYDNNLQTLAGVWSANGDDKGTMILRREIINVPDIVWQNNEEGYFYDLRDNNRYKVIKIGEQVWMAENINYKTSNGCLSSNNDLTSSGSLSSNNDLRKVLKYGYLYTWETAQKICPRGWRLANDRELISLLLPFGKIAYSGEETTYQKIFGSYDVPATNSTYINMVGSKSLNIPDLNAEEFRNVRTMFWSSTTYANEKDRAYAIYWRKKGVLLDNSVHFSNYPKNLFGFCRCIKN